MELSSMLETPCSMTPSAAMRSPARTTIRSPGNERRGVHFFLAPVPQQPRDARQLRHKALDGRFGAPGGEGLQTLAHHDDEHGFGGGQVLAHGKRRDHSDAESHIRRDGLFEQRGDGVIEGFVPGQQSDDDGRIEPEDGFENAGKIQKQQQAYERRKTVFRKQAGIAITHGWSL